MIQQALKMQGWLNGTAGWSRKNVLLLTDFGGSEDPGLPQTPAPNISPTRGNLDWAFDKWLPTKAQPGDLVVFYFAGQARAVQPADQNSAREYYLLPTDVQMDRLSQKGWSLDRALDRTVRRRKVQTICLLATTMQLAPPAEGVKTPNAGLNRLNQDWLRRLARWPGVTTWLAADRPSGAVAGDSTVTRLFTDAFLAGLGDAENKKNLAGCLQTLQRNSELKVQGFQMLGGIPPDLDLWADRLGPPVPPGPPEMVLQVGHADRVLDLLTTPDNQTLITASQDSTMRVWSPSRNELLRVLTGHAVGVTTQVLTDDGRWLISGGGFGEVLVHDLANEYVSKPVGRQPHEQGSRVASLCLLPDGDHFISVDRRGQAFLWDLTRPLLMPEPWLEGMVCRGLTAGGSRKQGALVSLCGDDSVRFFNGSGGAGTVIPLPDCRPSVVALSAGGNLLAVGCDDGRVIVRDLKSGKQEERKLAELSIERLVWSRDRLLAIGHEDGVRLLEIKAGPSLGQDCELISGRPAEKLAFSADSGHLAACVKSTGQLKVWNVQNNWPPKEVLDDSKEGVLSLVFAANGDTLITGSKLGTVKTWPLTDRRKVLSWTSPAHRGKVRRIATSPGRTHLMSINELGQAQVWDLAQRTCRRLAGTWSDARFLSDDTLVICGRTRPDQPARVLRMDRRKFTQQGPAFELAAGDFKVPPQLGFETLCVSPDGRRIAASTGRFQVPLVCVWETSSGRLTHHLSQRVLSHPAFSLAFSGDSQTLATAGNSRSAELWDLGGPLGALKTPAAVIEEGSSSDITCIQLRPGLHRQVVTGHSNGMLLLWNLENLKSNSNVRPQILAERYFTGAVRALTFSPDGHYLAASGEGTMIWLAEIEGSVRQIRDLGMSPHHLEQINTLDVWPDWSGPIGLALAGVLGPRPPALAIPPRPALLVSGSDDTTIRFWDLQRRTLLATFSAALTQDDKAKPMPAGVPQDMEWVLYSPEGHFDASRAGRELVRFRDGDTGRAMEQFDATNLYSFELTENLRAGRRLEPVPLEVPPPVAIDPPVGEDPTAAETRLTISLGSADLRDIRIYQNGVPIPSGLEDRSPPHPDRFEVRARLVPGFNRFYAMASREGAYDSRSQDVEVFYEGPLDPGRLHVVALGVGDYERERLTFATRDAERLSQVLHARGLISGQERGRRYLLTDREVKASTVERAFKEIAQEVRGRPQDTVVLFVAGHTGVFDKEQFCLLLPSYPFPRQSPLIVAARGANPPVAPGAKIRPEDLLPVSTLAIQLMRMEALNRLVIVDACQAGAILSDPQVQDIQKWMEISSRRARTAYLMATRRGEPALEAEPLRHGLFTYSLLRGMREVQPDDERPEISELKLRADADYNRDGTISTAELDTYVKEVMPPIAGLYPDLVVRRSAELSRPAISAIDYDQELRLQTARSSFPLIRLESANSSATP